MWNNMESLPTKPCAHCAGTGRAPLGGPVADVLRAAQELQRQNENITRHALEHLTGRPASTVYDAIRELQGAGILSRDLAAHTDRGQYCYRLRMEDVDGARDIRARDPRKSGGAL